MRKHPTRAPQARPAQAAAKGGLVVPREQSAVPLPPALATLIDTLPLALGDDADGYGALLNGITEAIRPRDIFEVFWVKDIADHTWEILRYRKLEAKLLDEPSGSSAGTGSTVAEFGARSLATLQAYDWVHEQMSSSGKDRMELWKEIEPERQRLEAEYLEDVRASRPTHASGPDHAAAFVRHAAELDRLSRAIALSEARRTAALTELERHRKRQTLPAPTGEVTDASFTEAP
jgi:hypothetical protein